MVSFYLYNDKIYSVDLMFAYINIYKPDCVKIDVATHFHAVLNKKTWIEPSKKNFIHHKMY